MCHDAWPRAPRKIFAGPRLKRLRRERQLTQAGMVAELDVSPRYLNLMDRNRRPITVQVLIRPTGVYWHRSARLHGGGGRAFRQRNGANSLPIRCFAMRRFRAGKCGTRPRIPPLFSPRWRTSTGPIRRHGRQRSRRRRWSLPGPRRARSRRKPNRPDPHHPE